MNKVRKNDITDKYSLIIKNKKKFEHLLNKIESTDDHKKRVALAKKAIRFALFNGTSYYSSNIIENVFVEISQNNTIIIEDAVLYQNSFLHVLSETYITGGHTRVVERWISNSPTGQKHSLVTTRNNNQQIPRKLYDNIIEKKGDIYKLKNHLTDIEKGLELRKIAMQYEYIILHVHMDDVVPLIAFGTEEFKRPVIFFNHADHLFWVGVSIADVVADIKKKGSELTVKRRMASLSFNLGLPIDYNFIKTTNKLRAKKKLAIPINKKVILTVGSSYKFNPILNLNYINLALRILEIDKDIVCYAIGPSPNEKFWKNAEKVSDGRIRAFGQVSHDKLSDYYLASEIMVDSIPLGGGTACVDAISCGCPVLTLDNPFGQFDYLVESEAYCRTETELLSKIKEMIFDERVRNINVKSISNNLEKDHSRTNWLKKVTTMVQELPSNHSVYQFENIVGEDQFEENDIWISLVYRQTVKKMFDKLIFMLCTGEFVGLLKSLKRKIFRLSSTNN